MVNNSICKFQICIYLSGDSVFCYLLNIFYRHYFSCLASMKPGKDLMSLWLSGVLCYLLLTNVLISTLQNSNGSAENSSFLKLVIPDFLLLCQQIKWQRHTLTVTEWWTGWVHHYGHGQSAQLWPQQTPHSSSSEGPETVCASEQTPPQAWENNATSTCNFVPRLTRRVLRGH